MYVGSGLCTWAKAYAGMECKFSAIMAKVWNESHIVQELFQTPFFPLYKALHGTFSKETKIPWEKYKIQQKIVNQKRVFSQNTLKSILFD